MVSKEDRTINFLKKLIISIRDDFFLFFVSKEDQNQKNKEIAFEMKDTIFYVPSFHILL